MSGIDTANGAASLRTCYAMSGTDIAYAPTRTGARASGTSAPSRSLRSCSGEVRHEKEKKKKKRRKKRRKKRKENL
eukprot:2948464-Rhodomonas_salina.2